MLLSEVIPVLVFYLTIRTNPCPIIVMKNGTKIGLVLPAEVNDALEQFCSAFAERHNGIRPSKTAAAVVVLRWSLLSAQDKPAPAIDALFDGLL